MVGNFRLADVGVGRTVAEAEQVARRNRTRLGLGQPAVQRPTGNRVFGGVFYEVAQGVLTGFGRKSADLDADVAVVVAYGRLIPAALLDIPKHGWLNLHFSLLPAWRGAAPVQRALIAGDTTTGASVFRLDEGMDTGPVYARLTEAIRPTDTSGDLLTRLAEAGAPLVVDVLRALNLGTAALEPQAEEGVTVAPMLTSADGEIRWADPARVIDRRVRGVTPAPGAHTFYDGARLRLGPVAVVPEVADLLPGQLRVTKHDVLVGTGACAVRLGQVAPAGKKWMAAEAWARGARPPVGAVLGVQGREL